MPSNKKILMLRLSSLGDVILSSAALQAPGIDCAIDWVVAKEYAAVLRGHPKIRKLWEFDRRSHRGLRAWISFGRQLWEEGYDEVVDLHGSIRTRLLKLAFLFWSLSPRRRRFPDWKTASKQRFESWGFILFKKLWPKGWLSKLQVEVFGKAAGGTGRERPDFTHLLSLQDASEYDGQNALQGQKYICVMPGSTWPGKTWPARKYLEVLTALKVFPVVMGTPRDPESIALAKLLTESKVPHFSGVGKWSLPQAAAVLAGSIGYLGSDTGLALLAEAIGVNILVIYGPTSPGLGFEPWREGSATAGLDLWCRPCGKIGHRCYRPLHRFKCLGCLDPKDVLPIATRSFGSR